MNGTAGCPDGVAKRSPTRGLLLVGALVAGCAANPAIDRKALDDAFRSRMGVGLRPRSENEARGPKLPATVNLSDGLTEEEAIAIALWNNQPFQSDLAALGVARADLMEAGMIRNPLLTLLFPLGPKQLEFTASLPLESLWQRPRRVAAAQLDLQRVAQSLEGTGLTLVRDVKYAFADLQLTSARRILLHEGAILRGQIADIAGARLKAGDISVAEASQVRTEATLAEIDQQHSDQAVQLAEDQVSLLLGLDPGALGSGLAAVAFAARPLGKVEPLIVAALALRPDLRASELAVEAVAARIGWEHSKILNQVVGIFDANGAGKEGFEAGPGLQIEVPLFNHNQAAIARARAEVERMGWQYAGIKQRIVHEVRAAHRQCADALARHEALRVRVLPALTDTLKRAQMAFSAGEASHLFVLETTRQLIDSRLRLADLENAARRAAADLDRAVGRKVFANE